MLLCYSPFDPDFWNDKELITIDLNNIFTLVQFYMFAQVYGLRYGVFFFSNLVILTMNKHYKSIWKELVQQIPYNFIQSSYVQILEIFFIW